MSIFRVELIWNDPIATWGGAIVPIATWGGAIVPIATWGGAIVPIATWGGAIVPIATWGGAIVPIATGGVEPEVQYSQYLTQHLVPYQISASS